jgi:hypothetical protein
MSSTFLIHQLNESNPYFQCETNFLVYHTCGEEVAENQCLKSMITRLEGCWKIKVPQYVQD